MADPPGAAHAQTSAPAPQPAAKVPRNPVFQMMGMPNIRMKLPSRNWTIFLTIVGSWTAAVVYDRREKKKIQRKWAGLVSHLASEPLPTSTLPRKLTVFVEAPPGDGLMSARDHFHEYVKPVLVAAALDWEAVEGRREGDIRAGLAEKIRKLRKLRGEHSQTQVEPDAETAVLETRVRSGIIPANAVAGDIVIGRHTWKEYVRGLHEGWLGPLDAPAQQQPALPQTSAVDSTTAESHPNGASPEDGNPSTGVEEKKPEELETSRKRKQPSPFNATVDYTSAALPSTIPHAFSPTAVIQFPHLLGFLNTPIRIYRFLNRRKLADDVGRQTAAAVLALHRPFHSTAESLPNSLPSDDDYLARSEQEILLSHEEKDWHKSVRDRSKDEGRERTWLEDIVLDSRISGRMSRFEISPEHEAKANEIAATAPLWLTEVWASLFGGRTKENDS